MYTLEFISGSQAGRHLTVGRERFVIGNLEEADLRLPDAPEKAAVTLVNEPPGLKATFAGDAHAEGRQGEREVFLRYGDVVALGSVRFRYVPTAVSWQGTEEERRVHHVQGITFALVILVILLEVALVVVLGLVRVDRGLPGLEQAAVKPPPESPAAADIEHEPSPLPPVRPHAESESESTRRPGEAAESTAATAPARSISMPVSGTAPQPAVPSAPPASASEETTAVAAAESPPDKVTSPATTAVQTTAGRVEPETIWPPVGDPDDPLNRIARQMVATALVEVLRHNFVEAHRQFERARILAPDFYPAYAEQAQLYEKQGRLDEAGKLWEEILKRCQTGPWYDLAARQRHRLTLESARRTAAPVRRSLPVTERPKPLPREVRIADVQLQNAGPVGEFSDIRLLNITLKSRIGHPLRDASAVRVQVEFYDRDRRTGKIVPSSAFVPQKQISLSGLWKVGETRNVSAAYLARREAGDDLEFYGFVVKVFYRDELQDQAATPETMLEKAYPLNAE